jgi:hypothetical protein
MLICSISDIWVGFGDAVYAQVAPVHVLDLADGRGIIEDALQLSVAHFSPFSGKVRPRTGFPRRVQPTELR